jgi:hypothetical protein
MKLLTALPLLLVAACSEQSDPPALKPGTYLGSARDALCIVGEKAPQKFAFIAFAAQGDTNCAAEGRVERRGEAWVLVPNGEGECQMPLGSDAGALRLGPAPPACAYYCGPGASLSGQLFRWTDTQDLPTVANPLAHDGVC